MSIFDIWDGLFGKAKTKKNPAKPQDYLVTPPDPASTRAKEMLGKIRRGKYEFSATEISEIIKDRNWLGSWQHYFVSLLAKAENRVEIYLVVPILGNICILVEILDLWHDQRVSSIDYQVLKISVGKMRDSFLRKPLEYVVAYVIFTWFRWKGMWQNESLRIVPRASKTMRLYVEWTTKQSLLLKNISVIGTKIENNSILFYVFRNTKEKHKLSTIDLHAGEVACPNSRIMSQLAVVFSWLLLGAYAFVLIHVTFPVLGGAFRVMPQSADTWDHFLLILVYNLCVMLLSYFFLRITMLPLYLKWNKSKKELAILVSVEERDHQYLRLLTDFVKGMQQSRLPSTDDTVHRSMQNVPVENIDQMIELMSQVREQSRQRLLGMTRMRRGWLQDLIIGYVAIFFLEWLYYQGLLTPLPKSIEWVNKVMASLFL
jgi:hypothetical protein